jgi:hypothetical protein
MAQVGGLQGSSQVGLAPQVPTKASNEHEITATKSAGPRAAHGAAGGPSIFKAIGNFFSSIGNKIASFFHGLVTPRAATPPAPPLTASTVMTRALDGSDPNFTADFRAFLKTKMAEENLDFLLAVNEYETNPTPEKAKEIVANFVDCQRPINPSSNNAETMFSAAKDLLTDESRAPRAFENLKEAIMEQLEFGYAFDFAQQRAAGK